MALKLADDTRFGFQVTNWSREAAIASVKLAEANGYESIWAGDHILFAVPILDPLLQLAQIAALSDKVTIGTCIYLTALRQPAASAKLGTTLDHISGGRFVFGMGVGGEFPIEFAANGVPHKERGARASESIEIIRKFWTGEKISHSGEHFEIPESQMLPAPVTPGGPPIWVGGRSPAAMKRAGTLCDGWISYVVSPEMYKTNLADIQSHADAAGRGDMNYGTGHLYFFRIDDDYDTAWDKATEHLSRRYAMDFRNPAKRYAALGTPEQVAEAIRKFHAAGVRHFVMDPTGPAGEENDQLARFAQEVRPLLSDL